MPQSARHKWLHSLHVPGTFPPLAALANQMWASGTSGFIAHTTLHHMNAKKRCVAVVVVSLVLQLVLVVSCCLSQPHWTCIWMAFACLPACLRVPTSGAGRRKSGFVSHTLRAIFLAAFLACFLCISFLISLNLLGVCLSVCVCVRRVT